MFEWIGDAISWIGDGIGWVWDHTIGAAVGAVAESVWDQMFEWLFTTIYDGIAGLFRFINTSTGTIFTLPWVKQFILLFRSMGWILFVCGLIVAVFDCAIAYENGGGNIKNTGINVLKGFMAVNLITVIPQNLYTLCAAMQGTFSIELLGSFVDSTSTSVGDTALGVIAEIGMTVSLLNLFFIILFGYCTVKVVFANIKRGGILLCQIAVGSLYMFGVPRGFTDGFYGWCRQVIATCLTVFLQTTILYLGLLTYTQHALLAIGLCLSATEVPRIAQMYGLDTSMKVNMMSVGYTVNMGSKAVKLMKAKA